MKIAEENHISGEMVAGLQTWTFGAALGCGHVHDISLGSQLWPELIGFCDAALDFMMLQSQPFPKSIPQ